LTERRVFCFRPAMMKLTPGRGYLKRTADQIAPLTLSVV
jgi:hypothetical protein